MLFEGMSIRMVLCHIIQSVFCQVSMIEVDFW